MGAKRGGNAGTIMNERDDTWWFTRPACLTLTRW